MRQHQYSGRLDRWRSDAAERHDECHPAAASDAQVAATVTGAGTVGFGLNKTAAANAFGAPANTTMSEPRTDSHWCW